MAFFRQFVLYLCVVALASGGVLARGYVLCVSESGIIRIEPANATGACQNQNQGSSGVSSPGMGQQAVHSACGNCQDLAAATPSARLPSVEVSPDAGSFPLIVSWLATWAIGAIDVRSLDDATSHVHFSERSSDLYAVRETIILLI